MSPCTYSKVSVKAALKPRALSWDYPSYAPAYIMNIVYVLSACVIQCRVQIFRYYDKSVNDQTRTFYLFAISFTHLNYNIIPLGIYSIYMNTTHIFIYISVFLSVPFSVLSFSNTRPRTTACTAVLSRTISTSNRLLANIRLSLVLQPFSEQPVQATAFQLICSSRLPHCA